MFYYVVHAVAHCLHVCSDSRLRGQLAAVHGWWFMIGLLWSNECMCWLPWLPGSVSIRQTWWWLYTCSAVLVWVTYLLSGEWWALLFTPWSFTSFNKALVSIKEKWCSYSTTLSEVNCQMWICMVKKIPGATHSAGEHCWCYKDQMEVVGLNEGSMPYDLP
jgi:hypothetical protein